MWERLHGPRWVLPGVPRWARIAAQTVPLVTLPSGLWRVAGVFGVPVAEDFHLRWWERPYICSITLVSECLALLTLGLIQEWGELWPRWIPGLAGRRIPVPAAVVPAVLGTAGLTAFGLYVTFNSATGPPLNTPQRVVFLACYLPLAVWPVLLAAVTVAYYRRRTGRYAGFPDYSSTGSSSGRWPSEARAAARRSAGTSP